MSFYKFPEKRPVALPMYSGVFGVDKWEMEEKITANTAAKVIEHFFIT